MTILNSNTKHTSERSPLFASPSDELALSGTIFLNSSYYYVLPLLLIFLLHLIPIHDYYFFLLLYYTTTLLHYYTTTTTYYYYHSLQIFYGTNGTAMVKILP